MSPVAFQSFVSEQTPYTEAEATSQSYSYQDTQENQKENAIPPYSKPANLQEPKPPNLESQLVDQSIDIN